MRKIWSIGLIRALIFQILGSAIGAGLLGLIRLAMGLSWKTEPALVVGGFIGAIFFMIGIGGFSGWWKMAMGEDVPEAHDVTEPE